MNAPTPKVGDPPFKFEATQEAAEANLKVLQSAGMSLDEVINNSPHSCCSFGSEFKSAAILEPLFKCHPDWLRIKSILDCGANYPMEELPEDVRIKDLKAALHKYKPSRGKDWIRSVLQDKFGEEIRRGFMLPLPLSCALDIPHAEYCPTTVILQQTINEKGEFVEKRRPIHDQSFEQEVSKTSINSRIRRDELGECKYGHMLLRQIHTIVGLRQQFPNYRILMSKTDEDAAYRRIHANGRSVAKSLTYFKHDDIDLILLCLRLTFGGTPGPSEFSQISESQMDLVNALLRCDDWDPTELRSTLEDMYPQPERLPEDIPLAKSKTLSVELPQGVLAQGDIFLDDGVIVGIDTPQNVAKMKAAMPLALELFGRRSQKDEPVPRDELIKLIKAIAEGALEELKIVTGWKLDTRRLLINLTDQKFTAWSNSITTMLDTGKTKEKDLGSLLGRMVHVSVIMPLSRHFLARLHDRRATMKPYIPYRLSETNKQDLKLCLKVLKLANKGISMNSVVFRLPQVCYFEDACNYGIGGWNSYGDYYDYDIPKEYLGRAHINELEFLANLVHLWIDIENGKIEKGTCVLIMGDSTTAMGWIHGSKYKGESERVEHYQFRLKIAWKLAELALDNDIVIYSQWFPGKHNIIADSLSRDTHLSDKTRISLFNSFFPPQEAPGFQRSTIPNKISSFVSSILLALPKPKQIPQERTNSEIATGSSGRSSLTESEREMIDIWRLFPGTESRPSSVPLQHSSGPHCTAEQEQRLREWLQGRSPVPSAMYRRNFVELGLEIQD